MRSFCAKTNNKCLLILLVIPLFLAGCTGYKPELKNKDTSFKFNEYHEIPYLKYEDIFDEKDNKQQHTGKYSNKTSDGVFDWGNMKSDMYHLTPIVNDMFKKITLDGKKINLPMSFSELGKEFRDFKNIDYSSLTDDVTPVTARDSNNNLIYIGKLDPYPQLKKWNVFMSIFDNENKFLIGLELNMENAMIYGLNNNGLLSVKELKVDDIGIGSTFNEMYEKFGKPNIVTRSEDGKDITVVYSDIDNKDNNYVIAFKHRAKIDNPKTKQKQDSKPYVITDISISILRDFLEKKK